MGRVQKTGDIHVVVGETAQRENMRRLVDVRFAVGRAKGLPWEGCWPLHAQLACQKMLRQRWLEELPQDKLGSNRKNKDSWYHVWCYQRFGGEGWVKIFFAFGVVDAHAVEIYNDEWAKLLRSKGFEPTRTPACRIVARPPGRVNPCPTSSGRDRTRASTRP